nr:putative ORF1 [Marmot picobirnavirus]
MVILPLNFINLVFKSHETLDMVRRKVTLVLRKGEFVITPTQIEYWKLQETKRMNSEQGRHNVVTESETSRHNVATENIETSKLGEVSRHNLASEGIETGKLAETTRHNQVSERLGFGNLQESVRHNQQTENIGYGQLAETSRHNQASEAAAIQSIQVEMDKLQELSRHNQSSENIQRINNAATNALKQAEMALQNKKINNEADAKYRDALIKQGELDLRTWQTGYSTVNDFVKSFFPLLQRMNAYLNN